jgi:hypothetical protein
MSLDIRSRPYDAFGAFNLPDLARPEPTPQPAAPATTAGAESGGVIDANAATKQQIQSLFKEQFGDFAADPQKFHAMMREVYGAGYDMAKAEQFRQAALRGDYSWLPPIKFVSGEMLGGGNGCFSAEDGCVYLNADLKDDPKMLARVYVEETGHFIDTQVNKNDAAGDEGELFRRILSGEHLTADTVAAIKAENDHGTIVVDGKVKEVEFWFGSDIVNGVKKAAKAVGGAVSDAAHAVGSAVAGAAKTVGNAVVGAAKSVGSGVVGALTSVGEGLGMVVTGIGGGLYDFGKNLIHGKVGEAFKGLLRGIDKGTFGAVLHVGDGLIDAGQKFLEAPTYLIPGGKWIRNNITSRIGDVAHTIFNTAVEVGRDLWRSGPETVIGFGSDMVDAAKALFKGDFKDAAKKFGMAFVNAGGRAIGGVADSFIRTLQAVVSVGSTALFIEKPGRPLNDEEKALLRKVYGDSLDLDAVRIKHGGANNLMAAHTVGNTIYMSDDDFKSLHDASGNLTEEGARLLTHEMGHVWQSQNGGGDYIHESLWNQSVQMVEGKSRNEAYNWRSDVDHKVSFDQLNPEQQAHILEEIGVAMYRDAHGGNNDGVADLAEFSIDENADRVADTPLTADEYAYIMDVAGHARHGELA